jgi:hypothetical protein
MKQNGFHEVVRFTDVNTNQEKNANGCYLYIRLNDSICRVEIAEMVEEDSDKGFYRIVDKQLMDCELFNGRMIFFIIYKDKKINIVRDVKAEETSLEII